MDTDRIILKTENITKVYQTGKAEPFKALDNVNLNCVLGTKTDGEYKSFLDDYDK